MTNLKSASIGLNKYCGPAVLAILTGKSTDECAATIAKISKQYIVSGVQLDNLLQAADRLGFSNTKIDVHGSLYRQLVVLATSKDSDGLYIITVPNHFVVVEVKDKQIYFCDNHTKEPISASASARLMQNVVACNKVTKRADYKEPELPKLLDSKLEVISDDMSGMLYITIKRNSIYNYNELNSSVELAMLRITRDELAEILIRLNGLAGEKSE